MLKNLLDELAELHQSTADVLRSYASRLDELPSIPNKSPTTTVVERARRLHPSLGPRQEQVLAEVADAGQAGATSGQVSRAMEYDQPNVYLTLQALIRQELVRKDSAARPHRYFLHARLSVDDLDSTGTSSGVSEQRFTGTREATVA